MFETIILVILFGAVIICGKILSNSFIHPIRAFSIIWAFFVLIPLVFWNINYKWIKSGSFWILATVFAMLIGGIIGNRVYDKNKKLIKVPTTEPVSFGKTQGLRKEKYSWIILTVIISLAFMGVLEQLSVGGFKLIELKSFESLLDVNTRAAAQRYGGEMRTSTVGQILVIFIYLSGLCGGYSYNYASTKVQRVVAVSSLLPIICVMLFSNGKAGFIAEVILWFSGWVLSYLTINKKFPSISFKIFIKFALVILSVLLILYFVMLLRVGDFSAPMRDRISQKFGIYAFGQMVSFDAWFADGGEFHKYAFGMNTYMSLFKTIGLVDRIQGIYEVYVSGYGNVFTAFRGVIMDFGIVGALLYFVFKGIIIQVAYRTIVNGKKSSIWAVFLLVCAYFFEFYGFCISPWVYASFTLVVVLFPGYILLFHRKIRFIY